jgi:hypothetical protein
LTRGPEKPFETVGGATPLNPPPRVCPTMPIPSRTYLAAVINQPATISLARSGA